MYTPDIFKEQPTASEIPKTTDEKFQEYFVGIVDQIDDDFISEAIDELESGIEEVCQSDTSNEDKIKTLITMLASINKTAFVSSEIIFEAITQLEKEDK